MSESVELRAGPIAWNVTIPAAKQKVVARGVTSSDSTAAPRELLRTALASPIGLNAPLRRALVPDDHAVVVVDESLPHVGELVSELLSHLMGGEVQPSAITLLVAPPSGQQPWVDELPDEFGDVHVEVHDPADVKKVAYLHTTQAGRRVYLNRTLVEAEFVVVLSGRRFDAKSGYAGAESALFPMLSNLETRTEFADKPADPDGTRQEATTVAWHLGAPMFVQVIEGPGDTIAEVVAGLPESAKTGIQRQDAHWRGTVDSTVDLVILTANGGERVNSAALRQAVSLGLSCLSGDGRLVLITDAPSDSATGLESTWAESDLTPHIYIAAGWDEDVIETLSATALGSAGELQRLIDAADRVIVIPDADRTLITVG